ncbi:hypothetical protein DMC30DRAFT_81664 [Rhodotorula diobovata]|uniref:Uncharacterized protein n=1 Tax=Rhodotorula diobovata TaxID=5288 RepID=A0A5C5FMA0_9BASI|nr:hypothetical protein DMC30DRAFT_81664 [Rhodotorula diobovata]
MAHHDLRPHRLDSQVLVRPAMGQAAAQGAVPRSSTQPGHFAQLHNDLSCVAPSTHPRRARRHSGQALAKRVGGVEHAHADCESRAAFPGGGQLAPRWRKRLAPADPRRALLVCRRREQMTPGASLSPIGTLRASFSRPSRLGPRPCSALLALLQEPTAAPTFRSLGEHPSAFASPTYDAGSLDVAYSALIEVFDLLGNVHELHRSKLEDVQLFVHETERLEQRLQRWYKSLPHEIVTAQTDSPFILVQALYWATTIKLLSLVGYPLFRSLPSSSVAANSAHSASVAIAALTKIIPIRSPYFAWACFVAARMLVLRAHRRREPIDPTIHDLGQAFTVQERECQLPPRSCAPTSLLLPARRH